MKKLQLLTGAFLLASCGPTPSSTPASSVESTSQSIIGGTSDTGDTSVVLVVASDKSGDLAFCTGEVVSPHVVMCAAHCVDPATIGSGYTYQIFLGNDYNSKAQQSASNFVAVKETHFNPKFNPNQLESGNDISVLITKTALTQTPLIMNRTPLDSTMNGQMVRLVGYGIDSGSDQNGTSAGTKRQTNTALTSYDSLLMKFGSSTHNTCEGDSGGPAFMTIKGQEVIAGITSFGDPNCTQYGEDTRVDLFASFVDGYITTNDPQYPNGGSGMATSTATATATSTSTSTSTSTATGTSTATSTSTQSSTSTSTGTGVTPATSESGATFGASCSKPEDCVSGFCYITGGTGYCTGTCDSAHPSCPIDGTCSSVSGQSFCLLSSPPSGCSFGGSGTQGDLSLLAIGLSLLGLVRLIRRRARQ